jgi:hypothetical protein
MVPSAIASRKLSLYPMVFILFTAAFLFAQEAQKTGFYDVQMTKDEIYTYTNLKFKGDYTSFESPSGTLALGRTEAGVTIVIILGQGNLTIEGPESAQEKIKEVFGGYPVKSTFKSIYVRLNPKEYEESIGKMTLAKAPSDDALAKAKELFDSRFLASYHAGPRAIFPPYKTRVFDFETQDLGQITNEEGYWLKLMRISPYGKVYASNFVNPKQKYGSLRMKPRGPEPAE